MDILGHFDVDTCDSESTSEISYSGLAHEGLNENHSYDRMLYNAESIIMENTKEVIDLVKYCFSQFEKSPRSRLLMRFKVNPDINLDDISSYFVDKSIELTDYQNGVEGVSRVTIGFNKADRAINVRDVRHIQTVVKSKIQKAMNGMPNQNFETFALEELQRVQKLGFSFSNANFTADELYSLWHTFFAWTEEQCQKYAGMPPNKNEQIFGIRDKDNTLLSVMLYSHRESTEWATLPEHQQHGLIVPLLIYANSHLVEQNIPEIFAELRFDRSVSPAVKSGMEIQVDPKRQSTLLNHVSIGGAPDNWNQGRSTLNDGTSGTELRSFVIGRVNPDIITPRVREAYVSKQS